MREYTTKELFSAACAGDIPTLRDYYDHGGKPNRRLDRFRKLHSLIAGALRNRETPTVYFLLSRGETAEPAEQEQLDEFLRRRTA